MYDAFISYSHARDKPIARALQGVVQTLGKPWWRTRSLRVFRDDTSLSATPEMWPSIERALADSRYLILLASPDAMASPWVAKEVAWWLENKSAATLLVALTNGELVWNRGLAFRPEEPDSPLAPLLAGAFAVEPLWIDLRPFRSSPERASKRDPEFLDRAASLAAAIRGAPKEDLISEELRQQRNALTLAWSAAALLTVFAAAAVLFAIQRQAALTEARLNLASALIGRAELARDGKEGHKALVYLAEAERVSGTGSWPTRSIVIGAPVAKRVAAFDVGDAVEEIQFDPGRNRMAALTSNGVKLIDLGRKAATVVLRFGDERRSVKDMLFDAPNNRLLARFENSLVAWSLADGAPAEPSVAYAPEVVNPLGSVQFGLAADPSGAVYFPASDEEIVTLDGNSLKKAGVFARGGDWVAAISAHPSGRFVAIKTGNDSAVGVIATAGPAAAVTLDAPASERSGAREVVFSPDGKSLAAIMSGDLVRVWRVGETGEAFKADVRFDASARGAGMRRIAVSPDSRLLAAAHEDFSASIWNLASGREIARLATHRQAIDALVFTPDSRALATGSKDGTVQFWEITPEHDAGVSLDRGSDMFGGARSCSLSFSLDGARLAVGAAKGGLWMHATEAIGPDAARNLAVADMLGLPSMGGNLAMEGRKPAQVYDFASHSFLTLDDAGPWIDNVPMFARESSASAANCVLFAKGGKYLLGLDGASKSLIFWEMPSGKVAGRQAFTAAPDTAVAHDGLDRVAVLLEDGTMEVGTLGEGTYAPLATLDPERELEVVELGLRLAFSMDGNRLLALGRQMESRLWDLKTKQSMVVAPAGRAEKEPILGVAGDLEFLVRKNEADEIVVSSIGPAETFARTIAKWPEGKSIWGGLASSPSGYLAVADGDGSVVIWDPRARAVRRVLRRDVGRLEPLAFDATGALLVARAEEPGGVIEFWDAETGQRIGQVAAGGPAASAVMSGGYPRLVLFDSGELLVKTGVQGVDLRTAEETSGFGMRESDLKRLGPGDANETAVMARPFVIDAPAAALWPLLWKLGRDLDGGSDGKAAAAPLRQWLKANRGHAMRTKIPLLVEKLLAN